MHSNIAVLTKNHLNLKTAGPTVLDDLPVQKALVVANRGSRGAASRNAGGNFD
jgi:hypothetical protein